MQADLKQNVADYAAEVTNDTWQKWAKISACEWKHVSTEMGVILNMWTTRSFFDFQIQYNLFD